MSDKTDLVCSKCKDDSKVRRFSNWEYIKVGAVLLVLVPITLASRIWFLAFIPAFVGGTVMFMGLTLMRREKDKPIDKLYCKRCKKVTVIE